MTLEEFVAEVRMGNITAETGGLRDGEVQTWTETLGTDDPEAIVAEAFAKGVIPFEMPFVEALEQVRRLLE